MITDWYLQFGRLIMRVWSALIRQWVGVLPDGVWRCSRDCDSFNDSAVPT